MNDITVHVSVYVRK